LCDEPYWSRFHTTGPMSQPTIHVISDGKTRNDFLFRIPKLIIRTKIKQILHFLTGIELNKRDNYDISQFAFLS
jgi:hypothetical protein